MNWHKLQYEVAKGSSVFAGGMIGAWLPIVAFAGYVGIVEILAEEVGFLEGLLSWFGGIIFVAFLTMIPLGYYTIVLLPWFIVYYLLFRLLNIKSVILYGIAGSVFLGGAVLLSTDWTQGSWSPFGWDTLSARLGSDPFQNALMVGFPAGIGSWLCEKFILHMIQK